MRFQAEEYTDQVVRRRPTGLVIVVALLAAAGTTAGLHLLQGPAAVGGQATVPILVGLSEDEARLVAEGAKLILEVTGSTPDPTVRRGAVAHQSPLAGTAIPVGGRVQVILSRGLPRRAPAP